METKLNQYLTNIKVAATGKYLSVVARTKEEAKRICAHADKRIKVYNKIGSHSYIDCYYQIQMQRIKDVLFFKRCEIGDLENEKEAN